MRGLLLAALLALAAPAGAQDVADLETVLAGGDPEEITRTARDLVAAARDGPNHGRAAEAAAEAFIAIGDAPEAVRYLEESLAVDPARFRARYAALIGALGSLVDTAESEGRLDDAMTWLGARITAIRTFAAPIDAELPGTSETFVRILELRRMGMALRLDRFATAETALAAAMAIAPPTPEERADYDPILDAVIERAQLANNYAALQSQRDLASFALTLAEALTPPGNPRRGLAMRELGHAELALGHIARAQALYAAAAGLLSTTPEGRASLPFLREDMGNLASREGDVAGARAFYGAARPDMPPSERATMLVNRAAMETDAGRAELSLNLLEDADAALAAIPEAERALFNIAVLSPQIGAARARALAALDRGEEAIAIQLSALGEARAILPEGHPDLLRLSINAADLIGAAGHPDEAREIAARTVTEFAPIFPGLPLIAEAREQLAFLELALGNRTDAARELAQATRARLSPAGRETLAQNALPFEILAWTQEDDPAAAFETLQYPQGTRSAEAIAGLEYRLSAGSPETAALLRARADAEERQRTFSNWLLDAHAGAAPAAVVEALTAQLQEAGADLAAIDTDLAASGLDTAGLAPMEPIPLAEVQALLRPGEALVTFVFPALDPETVPGVGTSANRVIAVTPGGASVATIPEHSRLRLRERIRAFRCEIAIGQEGCGGAIGTRGALRLPAPDGLEETGAARALHDDLLGGLGEVLAGADHLILVPPPDLLDLPFAALRSDRGPLIRSHAISVLPAVQNLAAVRRDPRKQPLARLLGVGDPAIGGAWQGADCTGTEAALRALPAGAGVVNMELSTPAPLADPVRLAALPRLPDTACELAAIRRLVGGDLLLGPEATETAVKSTDLTGYDALVFATHGLVAGETGARAPGLVLTPPGTATVEDDGLLTAAEVAALRLNARLVVLSACNTAAAEDTGAEGLSGLARAFFHAGAGAVLVTQWSVYSDAAVRITTGMFSRLAADPATSTAEALRQSMLAILDDPEGTARTRDPSYWAAFTLIGG